MDILKARELYAFFMISLGAIPRHKATVSMAVHFCFKALVTICDMCILTFSPCSDTTFPPTFPGTEWSAVVVLWRYRGAGRLSWRAWEGKPEEAPGRIQEDKQMSTWEFSVRGLELGGYGCFSPGLCFKPFSSCKAHMKLCLFQEAFLD